MPEPIPDINCDHQCYHYQAPSGQRCGSPALKGEYYCYHHHVKQAARSNRRVLIDPEVTCMELPVIEDRASIFVALAAVVHRLGANTIDTRRAGQMIYGLQVALRALEPPRIQRSRTNSAAESGSQSEAPEPLAERNCHPERSAQRGVEAPAATPPTHIPISKQSLLYFLRSRHCASCNAELFPAEELTERANPGAPPTIIEEARPALPAPGHDPGHDPDRTPPELPAPAAGTLPSLGAAAEQNAGSLPLCGARGRNDRQEQTADFIRDFRERGHRVRR